MSKVKTHNEDEKDVRLLEKEEIPDWCELPGPNNL